mmetsp:Transcript_27958/g.57417  ORF Transcript_27958/g.57417 Transcript_27958/m.57417 type:complete len:223 (-) Transcript_27958:258-926(-)
MTSGRWDPISCAEESLPESFETEVASAHPTSSDGKLCGGGGLPATTSKASPTTSPKMFERPPPPPPLSAVTSPEATSARSRRSSASSSSAATTTQRSTINTELCLFVDSSPALTLLLLTRLPLLSLRASDAANAALSRPRPAQRSHTTNPSPARGPLPRHAFTTSFSLLWSEAFFKSKKSTINPPERPAGGFAGFPLRFALLLWSLPFNGYSPRQVPALVVE